MSRVEGTVNIFNPYWIEGSLACESGAVVFNGNICHVHLHGRSIDFHVSALDRLVSWWGSKSADNDMYVALKDVLYATYQGERRCLQLS